MHDATVPAMLEQRLAKYRYVAIGEFHIYGKDADLPVMRRVVQLAKQHKLFLHSHSDADAIERQFKQDPDARVLWAHSGFDSPAKVQAMLAKHKNLWCDLAFRSDHATMGKVDSGWREAFLAHPDRFMVGTDTFTPERWYYVVEHANWTRAWLADLPRDVAERIGYRNGEALFAAMPLKPERRHLSSLRRASRCLVTLAIGWCAWARPCRMPHAARCACLGQCGPGASPVEHRARRRCRWASLL